MLKAVCQDDKKLKRKLIKLSDKDAAKAKEWFNEIVSCQKRDGGDPTSHQANLVKTALDSKIKTIPPVADGSTSFNCEADEHLEVEEEKVPHVSCLLPCYKTTVLRRNQMPA